MSKVAIVYWSGTGNTEAMANAVEEGAKEAGCQVDVFGPVDFSSDKLGDYDAIALGCPAMGSEQLEEEEFQPMFDDIKGGLKDKKVVLFGSYSWADGEWMETWQDEVVSLGANLLADGLAIYDAPDDDGLNECKELGKLLAK